MAEPAQDVLLEIRDLKTEFHLEEGTARAVRGVNLTVPRRTTVGLVGESGCGKSVTALSILRLIPDPPGKIVSGSIVYHGQDLLKLPMDKMQSVRGNKISMIFQEPMSSLNPVFSVGNQICEGIRLHQGQSKEEARQVAIAILPRHCITNPDRPVPDSPDQPPARTPPPSHTAMPPASRPRRHAPGRDDRHGPGLPTRAGAGG